MRLLIVSADGSGLDVAIRAMVDGHKVKLFVRQSDPKLLTIGDGLVDKVADFREWTEWADTIIPNTSSTLRACARKAFLWSAQHASIRSGKRIVK